MPSWINEGFSEYAKRLPQDFALDLIEIPPIKRTKNSDISRIKKQESQLLFERIPKHSMIVVLDENATIWSTNQLAKNLQQWHDNWQHVSLLIGGPDGLDKDLIKNAHATWSLSNLTFPHPLVRIIVAEQIYRAWTILAKHPYHRA